MPTPDQIVAAIPIIISLIIIEGLLSVDNALAIAAMASHLPGRQKFLALRWGIIGAYVFRGLALAFAAFIIDNPWLKIIGAAYLIHLMASFFAEKATNTDETNADEDEGAIARRMATRGFWATVASIELMDLSLSVDNVVAAVAMSPQIWVVCTGVFIGILALRFVAGFCIKLIERFPILESTAFILIGYVGGILIFELTTHIHVTSFQKFIGICIILFLSIWYAKRSLLFSLGEVRDPLGFVQTLKAQADPVSEDIWNRFSPETQEALVDPNASVPHEKFTPQERVKKEGLVIQQLNEILKGESIFDEKRFEGVSLSDRANSPLAAGKSNAHELIRHNRQLLEDAYPNEFLRRPEPTALRSIFRTSFAPIIRICRFPLIAYAAVSNFIFGMLFFPFKFVPRLFQKAG